jgi:hypothetical protein
VFNGDRRHPSAVGVTLLPGPYSFGLVMGHRSSWIDGDGTYQNDGRDLNGNGRPNLVMRRMHHGVHTFRVFELIDGESQVILEFQTGEGQIQGPDATGKHHFVGLLPWWDDQSVTIQIPLIAGATAVPYEPPVP